MDAIATLKNEHRLIERVLGALYRYASDLEAGQAVDRQDLSRFVTFIRQFADAKHHGKEEALLFQAMLENGFSKDQGLLAVMLHEHDIGRSLVKDLATAADHPGEWTDTMQRAVIDAAHGFTGMLRQHILKEDRILYPMALASLPADAMHSVDAACAAIEAAQSDDGTHQRLTALGNDLAMKYALDAVA